jgi:hypothetical protein
MALGGLLATVIGALFLGEYPLLSCLISCQVVTHHKLPRTQFSRVPAPLQPRKSRNPAKAAHPKIKPLRTLRMHLLQVMMENPKHRMSGSVNRSIWISTRHARIFYSNKNTYLNLFLCSHEIVGSHAGFHSRFSNFPSGHSCVKLGNVKGKSDDEISTNHGMSVFFLLHSFFTQSICHFFFFFFFFGFLILETMRNTVAWFCPIWATQRPDDLILYWGIYRVFSLLRLEELWRGQMLEVPVAIRPFVSRV